HQHRRRSLADRAASTLEHDVADGLAVVVEGDGDRHLVAAERVDALRLRIRVLEHSVASRVLVVIEDHLAIHLVETHDLRLPPGVQPRILWTLCRPSTRRSISSASVYR